MSASLRADGLSDITSLASMSRPSSPRGINYRPRPTPSLRSKSGLQLHTNQSALRQYTDYGRDGALRSPTSLQSPSLYHEISSDTLPQSLSRLDFFDREVVQVLLRDQAILQRLYHFARSRGHETNVEFLMKVGEYSRAVGDLGSRVSEVSTLLISTSMLPPTDLPPEVATAYTNHLKGFQDQTIPALGKVFRSTRQSVEDQVSREIYPDFVKSQLIHRVRMSTFLNELPPRGDSSASEYPGLGDSFIILDSSKAGSPIVSASDGFCKVTEYTRSEILYRPVASLDGPATASDAARYANEGATRNFETTHLVRNYRKDRSEYWSLVYTCSLRGRSGSHYCLRAQINVSENLGTRYRDIARVLDFGALESTATSERRDVQQRTQEVPSGTQVEKPIAFRPRKDSKTRSLFLNPFSRKSVSLPPKLDLRQGRELDIGLSRTTSAVSQSLSPPNPRPDDLLSPYPCFFVLRHLLGTDPLSRPDKRAKSLKARMPIVFCSRGALDLLGLGLHQMDAILDREIFHVLVEQGGSSTINRQAKTAIRDKLSIGESTTIQMVLNTASGKLSAGRERRPSVATSSGRFKDNISLAAGSEDGFMMSETLERGSERASLMLGRKRCKFLGHWTALKGMAETVDWIVLILSPAAVSWHGGI